MIRNVPRNAAVYGVDLGKNVFHVVGMDDHGAVVQRVKLRRDTLLTFFERAARAVVGMEACPGFAMVGPKASGDGPQRADRAGAVRKTVRQVLEERHYRRGSDRRGGDAADHAFHDGENNRTDGPTGASSNPRPTCRDPDRPHQSDACVLSRIPALLFGRVLGCSGSIFRGLLPKRTMISHRRCDAC